MYGFSAKNPVFRGGNYVEKEVLYIKGVYPMAEIKTAQEPEANQAWKEEVREKLREGQFIAVEGRDALLSSDVLTAIDVINTIEESRDETEEWNHIRKLQRERAVRFMEQP